MTGPRKNYDLRPHNKMTIFRSTRKEQSRISRVRLGGEKLKWKFKETKCECDNSSQLNTEHILLHCPLVSHSRKILKSVISPNEDLDLYKILNPHLSSWNKVLSLVCQLIEGHPQQHFI